MSAGPPSRGGHRHQGIFMSQAPDQPQGHSARAPESDSPSSPSRRRLLQAGAGAAAAGGLAASQAQSPTPPAGTNPGPARSLQQQLQRHIRHVVVIYLENRSFNNLFADFPGTLEPLSSLPPERFVQRDRNGQPLPSLPKVWGGMVPRSQSLGGKTYMIDEGKISGLPNAP
jgi:acid phosphatase